MYEHMAYNVYHLINIASILLRIFSTQSVTQMHRFDLDKTPIVFKDASHLFSELFHTHTLIYTILINFNVLQKTNGFSPDSTCGVSKGCFKSYECGSGDCTYLVTWYRSGDQMKFEFTSTITGSSKYLCLGFSDDDDMVSKLSDVELNRRKNCHITSYQILQLL